MLNLILESIKKHKLQSIATVLAILFGTLALFSGVLLFNGASNGLAVSKERLGGDILVIPSQSETSLDEKAILFGGAAYTAYFSADISDEISEIDGVTAVTNQFFGQTLGGSDCCSGTDPVQLIGVDFSTDTIIKPWLSEELAQELTGDNIVIGSDVTGFEGDPPYLILGHEVNPIGRLDSTGTSVDSCVYMDIDTVRSYMAEKEDYVNYWNYYGDPDTLLSAILVKTEENKVNEVSEAISAIVKNDCSVIIANDIFKEIENNMTALFLLVAVIVAVLMVICILQLFGQFYTTTYQRKQEFGLYISLGADASYIRRLILGEAGILAIIGTICGTVGGFFCYKLVLKLITNNGNFTFIEPTALFTLLSGIFAIVIFLIITAIAIIAPINKIKDIDPSVALKHTDID